MPVLTNVTYATEMKRERQKEMRKKKSEGECT
jgi:hypothetical protein